METQWSRALSAALLGVVLAVAVFCPCAGERVAAELRPRLGLLATMSFEVPGLGFGRS